MTLQVGWLKVTIISSWKQAWPSKSPLPIGALCQVWLILAPYFWRKLTQRFWRLCSQMSSMFYRCSLISPLGRAWNLHEAMKHTGLSFQLCLLCVYTNNIHFLPVWRDVFLNLIPLISLQFILFFLFFNKKSFPICFRFI